MKSEAHQHGGGRPRQASYGSTPQEAKAELLSWADSSDRRRDKWLGELVLAGGALAIVGCMVKACMPASPARKIQTVERVVHTAPRRSMLGNLAILLQVTRVAGPLVMEHLRKRAMVRRSEENRG